MFFMGIAVFASSTQPAVAEGPIGYGPNPSLPGPNQSLFPTVNIAPAKAWPQGAAPEAADGLTVGEFASGLDHPRWLYALPNGDILVAETNAPKRPKDAAGIKGFAMKYFMKKAGAGVASPDRITLLRDGNGGGIGKIRQTFLSGLNSPFGMALVGSDFYVANTGALERYKYSEGQTSISGPAVKVAELPGGPINHHWTKNVIASADGKDLYVSAGSNSNVAENGMENEINRAAILKINAASGASELFASGLRNPVGLAWNPVTGELWTAVNERDELGNDLVPDYITSVKPSGFYGWPYSYFGQNKDPRITEQRPDLVSRAIVPDYGLGSHTASLGLIFQQSGNRWPDAFREGAFVAQHGSWNRKPAAGYKVIFVPFQNGKPSGLPRDVLTGFLDSTGHARGRPVGLAFDTAGALLVADDVGNRIWRVSPAAGKDTSKAAKLR